MAKKTVIPQYNRSEHLRAITRKLLVIIEARIDILNTAKKAEVEDIKTSNDVLFGNKLSIAGNLVILADLLERLGDDGADDSGDSKINIASSLSEFDIKLIQDFVTRKKAEEAQI